MSQLDNLGDNINGSPSTVVDLQEYRRQISLSASASVFTNWKESLLSEIKNLENDKDIPPEVRINKLSILNAGKLCDLLSLEIEKPALGVENEGGILFEWFRKTLKNESTIFSIVVDRNMLVYSLYDKGKNVTCGTLNFSRKSLAMLFPLITEYFGILQDVARFKAK